MSACLAATPIAHLGRRPIIAVLTGVLVLAGGAGPAAAQPADWNKASPGVGPICQSVLGARPGEAHYVACVENLAKAQRGFERDRAIALARVVCARDGLPPGGPDMAECLLSRSRTIRVSEVQPVVVAERPGASKSYFQASPSEVHRREALSCAGLGLDPRSGAFARCVASLQSALFIADNPLN